MSPTSRVLLPSKVPKYYRNTNAVIAVGMPTGFYLGSTGGTRWKLVIHNRFNTTIIQFSAQYIFFINKILSHFMAVIQMLIPQRKSLSGVLTPTASIFFINISSILLLRMSYFTNRRMAGVNCSPWGLVPFDGTREGIKSRRDTYRIAYDRLIWRRAIFLSGKQSDFCWSFTCVAAMPTSDALTVRNHDPFSISLSKFRSICPRQTYHSKPKRFLCCWK